ncbi:MAG: hypothetical protein GYB31_20510 [Bacteroidetes bacterium]|nr:hypothetical protein [Bacteroidota bacterium]
MELNKLLGKPSEKAYEAVMESRRFLPVRLSDNVYPLGQRPPTVRTGIPRKPLEKE